MLKNLFTKKQTTILSAAFVIFLMVTISRVLGLIRDRLLTGRFTADELGVYFAAFRLPNSIFEILVMGAVSVAFIPVFTSYLSQDKKSEAYQVASSVINISLLVFALVFVFIFTFAPKISMFIAPGFNKEELKLMISFTRIMLFFQVIPLLIGNFLTGILQSFRQFLIPALAPVVYNLGIILGIIFLSPFFGLYGPVLGVILGSFLFLLIQLPFLSMLGYRHLLTINLRHPGVKEIGKLMIPRTIGMAASQIDSTIDLVLASLLGARSVTVFHLAQHLQLFPVGLFGLTIAQASLPNLSENASRGNLDNFKHSFLASFHQILFLIFPASAILIVLRIPAVRLVFGADRFDWAATVLTGKTLAFFSLSLFAQGTIHLLARAFYALYDSKTPVKIAVVSILTNTTLSIFFIQVLSLPVWALGLSTSVASVINAFFLLLILDRKVGGFERRKLILPFLKIVAATLITALFLYVPMKLFDQLVFDTTRTLNLLLLTGTASFIGLSVYLFLAWFFNIEEVIIFYNFAKKLIRVIEIPLEPLQEVVEEKI